MSVLPISAAFDQGVEKFKKIIREAVEKALVAADVSEARYFMRVEGRLLSLAATTPKTASRCRRA